jgi:hypothetical protein
MCDRDINVGFAQWRRVLAQGDSMADDISVGNAHCVSMLMALDADVVAHCTVVLVFILCYL